MQGAPRAGDQSHGSNNHSRPDTLASLPTRFQPKMGPTVYFAIGFLSLDGGRTPAKGGHPRENHCPQQFSDQNGLKSLFMERLFWVLSFAKTSTGTMSSCFATNPSRASKPSRLMATLHSSVGGLGPYRPLWSSRAFYDRVFEAAL